MCDIHDLSSVLSYPLPIEEKLASSRIADDVGTYFAGTNDELL